MELSLLTGLGLSEYEAKALLALTTLGEAAAAGIAKRAKLPQNKVYEVLESLREEGLVLSTPSWPRTYVVKSLETLRRRAKDERQRLLRSEQALAMLQQQVSRMPATSEERFWIIRGQRNIVRRLNEETALLESESLGVVRNLYTRAENIRVLKAATARGVQVRILCLKSQEVLKRLKYWKESGVEFRLYDERVLGVVGTRFNILDRRKVRITIGKPEVSRPEEYLTLWCESPSFAAQMRAHFLSLWRKAERV